MSAEWMTNNRFFWGLLFLSLLALILRVWDISATPPSADDLTTASSAFSYMERGHSGLTMWQHPKLRNIVVYGTLNLFGGSVWGLKGASLVFGVLAIPTLGLLARQIFHDNGVALLAAFFMALDLLHIDFSRQAIQEVYMPFFTLGALILALRYRDGKNPWQLVLSGVLFGLGLSSKWYVLFPLAVTFLLLLLQKAIESELSPRQKWSEGIFLTATLAVLPLLVYILTYTPWFLRGYGMGDWLFFQKVMYIEATTHGGFNPYEMELDHNPALWFIKPVAFADFIFGEGRPWILLAIPNPLVWLLTLPAAAWLSIRAIRAKEARYGFLALLFCGSYVPLVVAGRPIWLHTALAVTPFAFMASAWSVLNICRKFRYGKALLGAYLVAVTAVATPLYLLAVGKGHEISPLKPLVELYRPSNEQ